MRKNKKLPKYEYKNRFSTGEGLRYYIPPNEKSSYPGVTSVLGIVTDNSWIKNWENRVGKEKADEKKEAARNRGVIIHAALEDYTKNKNPDWLEKEYQPYWQSLQGFLATIEEDLLIEGFVWSRHKYAGTVDRVSVINGIPHVIDWKTSNRKKQNTKQYKLQIAAYTGAINWVYNLNINHGKIAIALPDKPAQIININPKQMNKLWEEWLEKLKVFHELKKEFG